MFTALSLFAGKVASNPALRKIAYIIGVILAACLGIYLVREQAKSEQRATDKAREVKDTIKTVQAIQKEAHNDADKALAARDAVLSGGSSSRVPDPASDARIYSD